MADYTVNISLDAENKRIVINVVDAAGAVQADWGQVLLPLGKDPGGTPTQPGHAMGQRIELRETEGCDATGTPQYCMMLRSAWYPAKKTSNPKD